MPERAKERGDGMNPLFRPCLKREELLALPAPAAKSVIRVAVHRNHSFELVASAIAPFLGLARLAAELHYSAYDDSLSFAEVAEHADLHLLWIDAARYSVPDFGSWILSRIAQLRRQSEARILVACLGAPAGFAVEQPDLLYLDCDDVLSPLGSQAFDGRLEPFTGTRLSNQACLYLARELGCRQIPALMLPALKALVLDLDNTLYAGVLGEDGIHGVKPYHEVQARIAELGRQGFLLALASKNEEEDVLELFRERRDFALAWEDFAAAAINWRPKAENIAYFANALNIGTDSVLFVDDNPGERLHAAKALPELFVLEADGPEETLTGLRYFPGLVKIAISPEDRMRSADIRANRDRERLRASVSREEYCKELGISLRFEVNPAQFAVRIHELLHKTNQWVLKLLRPSERDVEYYLASPEKCVITVSMSDRLSESGLIAVGLFSRAQQPGDGHIVDGSQNDLCMDELAVSCRALGRGVEDGMAKGMIRLASVALKTGPEVRIAYTEGPRNRPALSWLEKLIGRPLSGDGQERLACLPDADLSGVKVEGLPDEMIVPVSP